VVLFVTFLVAIAAVLEVGVFGSVSSSVRPGLRLAAAIAVVGGVVALVHEIMSLRASEVRVSDSGLEAPGPTGAMRTVEWSQVAGVSFHARPGTMAVVRVQRGRPLRLPLRLIDNGDRLEKTVSELWSREQARRATS